MVGDRYRVTPSRIKQLLAENIRPDGDCVVWLGYIDSGGRPRLSSGRSLRPLVLAVKGRRVPPSSSVVQSCETRGCVEHLLERPKRDLAREAYARRA